MARIAGVDIPNQKRVEIALTYIYGIGRKSANDILVKTGIDPDTRAKDLTEEQIAKLRDEIENNYVVDLHLECIEHPEALADDLINTVGVVEHGLFLHMVDQVIVGDPNGPRVLTNSNK